MASHLKIQFLTDDDRYVDARPDRWKDSSTFITKVLTTTKPLKKEDPDDYDYIISVPSDYDTFLHIVRYLRTGILPLFWNKSHGHDYALYQTIKHDATSLGIKRLRLYIEREVYLEAIKCKYEVIGANSIARITDETNSDVEREHPAHVPPNQLEYHHAIDKQTVFDPRVCSEWAAEYIVKPNSS